MGSGPYPPRYRRWTEAEAAILADAIRNGRGGRCPVDGRQVELAEVDMGADAPVRMVSCRTCGNLRNIDR